MSQVVTAEEICFMACFNELSPDIHGDLKESSVYLNTRSLV